MQEDLVRALSARRRDIRVRWEALLRIERVNTPLANPEALVFMLDWTFDEIIAALQRPHHGRRRATSAPAVCPCGRNPLLAYFAAGKQALVEALVLAQAEHASLEPAVRDEALAELKHCVHELTRREIESFCSVCQFRSEAHPAVLTGSGDT
jgi:hypothetical protein